MHTKLFRQDELEKANLYLRSHLRHGEPAAAFVYFASGNVEPLSPGDVGTMYVALPASHRLTQAFEGIKRQTRLSALQGFEIAMWLKDCDIEDTLGRLAAAIEAR
jgi:hypothetical protein